MRTRASKKLQKRTLRTACECRLHLAKAAMKWAACASYCSAVAPGDEGIAITLAPHQKLDFCIYTVRTASANNISRSSMVFLKCALQLYARLRIVQEKRIGVRTAPCRLVILDMYLKDPLISVYHMLCMGIALREIGIGRNIKV